MTFERQYFVHSRRVKAVHQETGVSFEGTVEEVGTEIYGGRDAFGSRKVSNAARSGEITLGYSIFYVDDGSFKNVHYPNYVSTPRPVFPVDIHSGRLIKFHLSMVKGAKHIKETQVVKGVIKTIHGSIKNCVNQEQGKRSAYGFKWIDARPLTNIPVEEDWDLECVERE